MKVLVLGADGTIGSALAQALVQRGAVVHGTTRRAATVGQGRTYLDLASSDIDSIPLPEADVAFFCASIVSYAECRADPARARQVNVTNATALARRLVARGTRVALLSTSAVFGGAEAHVPADRPPCPTTVYGQLASEAERHFAAFGAAATIVRLTKLITRDSKRFTNWIDALSRGQAVVAFSDLCMAPISFDDIIPALAAIAERPIPGIVQISGATDISYYQAASHIASQLGADAALVIEGSAANAGIRPEEITRHSSLDTSRYTEITGRPAPQPFDLMDSVFGSAFGSHQSAT